MSSTRTRETAPGGVLRLWALLAALAIVAAGCGGKSAPQLSPRQIVDQCAAKTAAVKSFHLTVEIQHVAAPASGLSLTFADGDVVVPDRLQARVGGTFEGIPLSSELIVIGDRHYLKNPLTGKWQTIDVSLSPVAFFDPSKGVLSVIKAAQNLSADGSEKVGGVDSYRLQAKVPATALAPLLGTKGSSRLVPVELWIGKKDLLLRRVRVAGPIAPSEGKGAVRTIDLSGFGEKVTISAPKVSP